MPLWWLAGKFKSAATDFRRNEADLGLFDEAVPDAEAYCIRLFDDDLTPMDFVVESLQATLNLSREHALQLMLRVHQHGSVDIGRMPAERAHGFVASMLAMSREHKQPFRCEAARHESGSDVV
jgi:ATP-dependent Clp protease adaptor protein ClpS